MIEELCTVFVGNNLIFNIVLGLIGAVILSGIGFFVGLVVENYFNLIRGKDHKVVKLSKKYDTALDCVHLAEVQLPDGAGTERFRVALGLYQKKMGDKSVEEDANVVQVMFNLSTLKH